MAFDLFNPVPDNYAAIKNSTLNDYEAMAKVEGLQYIMNYINKEEEAVLMKSINSKTWITDLRRRVQHYGWRYDYKAHTIDANMYLGPLPSWIYPLATRLHDDGYISKTPDQIIVNEYIPGQGIANHIDCMPCFGDTIISISLNSTAVMDFINIKTKEKIEVLLEPRSLVVISGASRKLWTHGIPARKADSFNNLKIERKLRLSLTFREVIFKRNIDDCKI